MTIERTRHIRFRADNLIGSRKRMATSIVSAVASAKKAGASVISNLSVSPVRSTVQNKRQWIIIIVQIPYSFSMKAGWSLSS